MLSTLPQHFFEVRYATEKYPGNAAGLADGANCQHFCYEILRHFGYEMGDLRSSELWADQHFTTHVLDLRPLDLVLFNRTAEAYGAYGAHVGICVGGGLILHLARKQGKPVVWTLAQFQECEEYACCLGFKRSRRGGG